MPIYQFTCETCGKSEDFLMRLSDPHPEVMTGCSGGCVLKKDVGLTEFRLRGNGWHETDFKGVMDSNKRRIEQ